MVKNYRMEFEHLRNGEKNLRFLITPPPPTSNFPYAKDEILKRSEET